MVGSLNLRNLRNLQFHDRMNDAGSKTAVAGRARETIRAEVLGVARQVAAIVRHEVPDREYRVFLFGSWATGNARERSDIDIGIQGPVAVDSVVMLRIREACDALPTLYTVDVVDMAQLAPALRLVATSQVQELEEA